MSENPKGRGNSGDVVKPKCRHCRNLVRTKAGLEAGLCTACMFVGPPDNPAAEREIRRAAKAKAKR